MLGAGRMGGALIEGWLRAGTYTPGQLIIRDPYPSELILNLASQGCRINPEDDLLALAPTVILAVKPQIWRETAMAFAGDRQALALSLALAIAVPVAGVTSWRLAKKLSEFTEHVGAIESPVVVQPTGHGHACGDPDPAGQKEPIGHRMATSIALPAGQ